MLPISLLSYFLCLVITAGVGIVLKIGSNGRAHEACWLMDGLGWNGLFGWLGLVAQPGEGIVVHGRKGSPAWDAFVFVFRSSRGTIFLLASVANGGT